MSASAQHVASCACSDRQRDLPVAAPERIVATQAELIGRLQDGLAFSDERFTALVRPVIERYAAFVHLLPAS